jgi:hypothetical protein
MNDLKLVQRLCVYVYVHVCVYSISYCIQFQAGHDMSELCVICNSCLWTPDVLECLFSQALCIFIVEHYLTSHFYLACQNSFVHEYPDSPRMNKLSVFLYSIWSFQSDFWVTQSSWRISSISLTSAPNWRGQ